MIYVVNKHTHISTENDFYIGRGSPLGNPYTSIQSKQTKAQFICQSPQESISNFHKYILERIGQKDKAVCDELNKIWKAANIGDVYLVCFCTPKPCHGTIIKRIIEDKLNQHKTYEGQVDDLGPNQIFVFGSNTQGRHGKGAALTAKNKFGAVYGQAKGLQGKSYAIITKDLTKSVHPSRTAEEIQSEIKELYDFARNNNNLEFIIPYNCNGSNLNFYLSEEMAKFFSIFDIPKNIVFEKEFYKLIKKNCETNRDI